MKQPLKDVLISMTIVVLCLACAAAFLLWARWVTNS